jgi:hypothetical protein
MMKKLCGLVLALSVAGAALAASWETSSMRTPGGGLIVKGMTSHEVRQELGEPLRTHSSSTRHSGAHGKTPRGSETWTYRGLDGMYAITFSGGKVFRIEVTPSRD